AMQALSQLSYTPNDKGADYKRVNRSLQRLAMMFLAGGTPIGAKIHSVSQQKFPLLNTFPPSPCLSPP
ncbi:MAG: hypothetical protein ACKVQA_18260, partial [Burkholderiales bacterium]